MEEQKLGQHQEAMQRITDLENQLADQKADADKNQIAADVLGNFID